MADKPRVKLTQKKVFWVTGVNPQPWSVPRGNRFGGRPVKSDVLHTYQQAVKEQIQGVWEFGPFDSDVPIALSFAFWRQIENEQDASGRWHRGKIADATNLQKALEDALQGVLFTNDRYVADVRSRIIEQSPFVEPRVGISIRPATGTSLQLEFDFSDEG